MRLHLDVASSKPTVVVVEAALQLLMEGWRAPDRASYCDWKHSGSHQTLEPACNATLQLPSGSGLARKRKAIGARRGTLSRADPLAAQNSFS